MVSIAQLLLPLVFTAIAGGIFKSLPDDAEEPDPRPINYVELLDESDQHVLYSASSSTGLTGQVMQAYQQFLVGNVTSITDVSDSQDTVQDNLWKLGEDDRFTYQNEYMVSAHFEALDSTSTNVTALFNNQAFHTPSLTLSMIANAIMNVYTNGQHSSEITNHPLPR